MIDKFPTSKSFQRLNNFNLDETTVFDDLAKAKDYAENNLTVYRGQIIHVKDARTNEEKSNGVNAYEKTYYINYYNELVPICSFTYETVNLFLQVMRCMLKDYKSEAIAGLDKMKEIMYDNYTYGYTELPTGDYYTQPWHPANFTEYQMCYRVDPNKTEPKPYIAFTAYGAEQQWDDPEKITVMHNGVEEHYRVYTFPKKPIDMDFKESEAMLEIIHMCDTSQLTHLTDVVSGCKNLTNIRDINTWDVSNCTSFESAFENCKSLISLDLSGWNTSNVTTMYKMFDNCESLTLLNTSGWDTSKVKEFTYLFRNCKSLETIDLSYLDTSKLVGMSWMFYGCSNLISINLSGIDLTGLGGLIEYVFYDCVKLEYIDFSYVKFPSSISFSFLGFSFTNCNALFLENINFTGCSWSLKELVIDRFNKQAPNAQA
jgi:surface protein